MTITDSTTTIAAPEDAPKKRASKKVQADGPEIQQFDPEMLHRRGNYMVLVTPEMAKEWLAEHNAGNRKFKRNAITRYARDMKRGKWNPDASDIKFDRTLNLIDGQNRLFAAVEANVSFPTLIRTCIAAEARDHVDQGVRRSIADSFQMAGVAHYTAMGAAVVLRARYEAGMASGNAPWQDRRVNLTHQEAIDYLGAHPMMERMGTDAQAMSTVGPQVPKSVWVAFASMCAEANEQEARRFADMFIHGEVVKTVGDPILALTRYVAQAKPQNRGPGIRSRISAERHLLALVLAWNAWRLDEDLDRIVVRSDDTLVPAA